MQRLYKGVLKELHWCKLFPAEMKTDGTDIAENE
jgi:hypothetical protein